MKATTEPTDVSAEVLMGQVVEEFLDRLNRGERPEVESYAGRYPQLASVLRQMLPALELMRAAGEDLAAKFDELPPPPALAAGCLGDYRILREVGRGGMGVVFEAEQISLGRRVALKVLPFASTLDPKQLQRFHNEAHAAAQLHHTHIVPVYATGCERGVHFYAMQYVEGQTLAALISELRQQAGRGPVPEGDAPAPLSGPDGGADSQRTGPYRPEIVPTRAGDTTLGAAKPHSSERSIRSAEFFRTVARLGIQAAEALEHAHQLGIIHRDIKPGNLLVETTSPLAPGGRGVGGEGLRLWVTDFGLAHVQSQAGLTLTGDLLGMLRYMSPEQALAQRVPVDHRTDLYSLGVTLYELLTLEPAFGGENRQELLRQIAFEEPRLVRRLNRAVPAELETIVGKAMEKNPADRYATAQELADDLERFLKDEPIRARRPTLVQRARKWMRRHRTLVWSAAVSAALLLVLAVAGLAIDDARVSREKEHAQQALDKERSARAHEWQESYFRRVALAHHEYLANRVARANQLLDECVPREEGQADLRSFEWYYLKRLCEGPLLTIHGREYPEVGHPGAALSPDGSRLAMAITPSVVLLLDTATGQRVPDYPPLALDVPGTFGHIAFSPDGQYLAAVGEGAVKVWHAATGQEVLTLRGHRGPINAFAFSPDGRRIATANGDMTVTVWDTATGREVRSLQGPSPEVRTGGPGPPRQPGGFVAPGGATRFGPWPSAPTASASPVPAGGTVSTASRSPA
jgi:serine/threonine protein kinase